MTTDKQAPDETTPLSTALRRFLDAAGGEGLVLDGVDAGDLYVSLYGYEPPPKPAMIAGTRISVSAIQSFHKAGYDTAGIIAEYPDLTEADVKAALAAQPAPAVQMGILKDWTYTPSFVEGGPSLVFTDPIPPAMPEPVLWAHWLPEAGRFMEYDGMPYVRKEPFEWSTVPSVLTPLYAAPLPEPAAGEDRRDASMLDWLGKQCVVVRTPLRYGSRECFSGSPDDNDGESVPWNIRAAIRAAMSAIKGAAS